MKNYVDGRFLWLRVFITLALLYAISLVSLIITQNPILFPTVSLVGNFIIPITFSAFFYARRHLGKLSALKVIIAFAYGGVLGVVMASILEPIFINKIDFLTSMEAGLIEEFVKLFTVYLLARNLKHKSQINGMILGAAVGMGFAALESMGYTFTTFLESNASLSATVYITLIRGIISPAGHGLWTAISAGVLFRESIGGKFRINQKVAEAYLLVSLLHGLRDALPFAINIPFLPGIDILLAELFVGIVGFYFLWKVWHEALKRTLTQNTA